MIYYLSKEPFDFKTFKTIRSFGENICRGKITINEANEEQADLIDYILDFNSIVKQGQKISMTKKKRIVLNTAKDLYEGSELVINALKSGLFPLKSTTGTGLKILTPKQMLQRLPIALAQAKADNSENLLNEIRKIVYSL